MDTYGFWGFGYVWSQWCGKVMLRRQLYALVG